jgi:hypothetical protein
VGSDGLLAGGSFSLVPFTGDGQPLQTGRNCLHLFVSYKNIFRVVDQSRVYARTPMSNPLLPPEILDHIVDLLHDNPRALVNCCLVSKSWVSRTRKHLFAHVRFGSAGDLELWKNTFLDPSNSPAYYTITLFVGCPQAITEADAEEGGWIRTFSRVARLKVKSDLTNLDGSKIRPVIFQKFSPTLKSLRLVFTALPSSQVSNLVRSFPLLEDLALVGRDCSLGADDNPHGPQAVAPSTSPPLTGPLVIFLRGGIKHIVCQLLSLPGGIHFRKLVLTWFHEEDPSLTTALIERCPYTLESLDITYSMRGMSIRRLHPHR